MERVAALAQFLSLTVVQLRVHRDEKDSLNRERAEQLTVAAPENKTDDLPEADL